ncbi:unnamed protein product [Diabrotica balteata]|uniref:SUN domain-containing protein n=1 Tax=Diabrotica balteata TaxID=107213 RepID=A0A9N9SYG2_DIABA|nr:unnamed protein product [Diabrotica balteata]
MDTRSRRSKSRTPFTQVEEFSKTFLEKETIVENNVRVTRSSTSYKVKDSTSEAVDEVTSTNARPITKSSHQSERVSRKWHNTSDYSSEGENEVSSTKSISQNEKNQMIQDARAAANGGSEVSALDLYKKSGRYWDVYPKTDYTYSPLSGDRVELAPGVVAMPNMSRKTIHSVHSSSDESHLFTNVEHKHTNTESYISRSHSDLVTDYKPRQLFNNNYESNYSKTSHKTVTTTWWTKMRTSTITTVTKVVTTILSILYFGFRVTVSWFSKLHKLSSTVMLMDTWLLWKNENRNKSTKLAALCIIPLLLLGGWSIWSNLGSIFNKGESDLSVPIIVPKPEVKYTETVNTIPAVHIESEVNINDDNEVFINQQKIIDGLKDEIIKLRSEMVEAERARQNDLNRIMSGLNSDRSEKAVFWTQRVNRCCKNPYIDIDNYISKVLTNFINDPEFLRNQKGFNEYLRTILIARQELEYRIGNITSNFDTKYENLLNENTLKLMEEVTLRIKRDISKESKQIDRTSGQDVSISDQHIKKLVRGVLDVYDADKTGLVDYAMESMGAQVLSTRCTENYHSGNAVVSVLGIPLWYPVNSPRTVITPGINPGQCWAFQNFPGFIMIRLSRRIKVEAFSMEHINRLLVPNSEIDSAPKNFEVYGLKDENDSDLVLLGEYVYEYDGDALQFFDVQKDEQIFEIIELRILSNHGNPKYTCLYRFRVHGKLIS